MNYQEIAKWTDDRLTKQENAGWISKYADYCEGIKTNEAFVESVYKNFRINPPLRGYLSVGMVKDVKNTVTMDLRIMGLSVAELKVSMTKKLKDRLLGGEDVSDDIRELARVNFRKLKGKKQEEPRYALQVLAQYTSDPDEFNRKTKYLYDEKQVPKGGWKWKSTKLEKFRSLIQKEDFEIKNEHSVETLMLDKLSESHGKDKFVPYILPCKIGNKDFQLVTPLAASKAKNGKISYSATKGGGIDILARARQGNGKGKSELCVIELKDKYEENERPAYAIKQAIAYATFVIRLLRSEEAHGQEWYKLFEINEEISPDKPITINAVIAMPYPGNGKESLTQEDTEFAGEPVEVGEGKVKDIIKLHYMYFKKEALTKKKSEVDAAEAEDYIITSLFKK